MWMTPRWMIEDALTFPEEPGGTLYEALYGVMALLPSGFSERESQYSVDS